jgi:hypothetical protein
MAGKSKSQLKQDKNEDMKKILINTATIKVPSIMTKYDRETKKLIKIHTLTKGNNITKRNKKPVIKLISDAINSIVIERQGKTRNRVIEKRKLKKQI